MPKNVEFRCDCKLIGGNWMIMVYSHTRV